MRLTLRKMLIALVSLILANAFLWTQSGATKEIGEEPEQPPAEIGEETGGKFNPGHYVALGPGDTGELASTKYLDEPAVRGVNRRYHWRRLEPEEGAYDFTVIEEDLDYLASMDKQLVVFVIDSSFWIEGAMPDYLSEYQVAIDGGFACVRWHPVVVGRLIALGQALGEHFDNHPNFEGVAVQESSIFMEEEDFRRFAYSPDRYRDALIEILTGLQDAMPSSRVFWYQNFMEGNDGHLRQVADAIQSSGVIMGGPDILPYRRWIKWESYPLYEEYKDRITLFCSAQDDSYKHHKNDIRLYTQEDVPEEGYLTMEEIFLFARDSLHVRYLFWNYYYEGLSNGERSYDDAIEVVRKYPVFNENVGPKAARGR